jgi:N-formylglutamate amidohydrolase
MKPFFLSIPHSGERVPDEVTWLRGLAEPILMCDVDRFVDRLYSPVVHELNLTCVMTQWHRYVVDLNRLPGDVDRDSVTGSENAPGSFTRGLHWVKTTRGTRLMPKPIPEELHEQLVERYFRPFHADVESTYEFFRSHGAEKIYHIDAHSMPSLGTEAHRDPGEFRADIVVSDWEGRSCETAFKDLVIEAYSQTGLKVGYNWPYVGGRVTQTYGHPKRGQNAIQVEINRSLYMDEESKQLIPDRAHALTLKLTQAIKTVVESLPDL